MLLFLRGLLLAGLVFLALPGYADSKDFVIGGFDPSSNAANLSSTMSPQETAEALQALLHSPQDPVGGNPRGSVTLVEFFDYQCSHCTAMSPTVMALIKANPDLRVVFKEFPIRGSLSTFAAKACLAAGLQGKFMAMHEEMMNMGDEMSEDHIIASAQKIGLDTKKLQQDINSPEITAEIERVNQLARKLQLFSTPAFYIAKTHGHTMKFINGEVTQSELQDVIHNVAASNA